MKRHFYISDDLDDLDRIEDELESSGVHRPQIHVFSRDDTGVDTHDHLHNINSILKKDVIHGTLVGASVGAVLFALVLLFTAFFGWAEAYSWWPYFFLAAVMLGFATWLGGLYGIQEPHKDLKRFESQLRQGKHVFIVDVDQEQENNLDRIVSAHPGLQLAGTGTATPRWIVFGQYNVKEFTSRTFP
jgi:hypothetical protein